VLTGGQIVAFRLAKTPRIRYFAERAVAKLWSAPTIGICIHRIRLEFLRASLAVSVSGRSNVSDAPLDPSVVDNSLAARMASDCAPAKLFESIVRDLLTGSTLAPEAVRGHERGIGLNAEKGLRTVGVVLSSGQVVAFRLAKSPRIQYFAERVTIADMGIIIHEIRMVSLRASPAVRVSERSEVGATTLDPSVVDNSLGALVAPGCTPTKLLKSFLRDLLTSSIFTPEAVRGHERGVNQDGDTYERLFIL
jgi:hypothetical protein